MGQRLNIEIHNNNGVLANSYYHWGAYTNTALDYTQKITDVYSHIDKETCNDLKLAVMLLQATGAGIGKGEYDAILSDSRFCGIHLEDSKSRNDGIIKISEEGIKNTREYEEGRVIINIEAETFMFDVFRKYELEEFEAEYGSEAVDALFRLSSNQFATEISFEQVNDFKDLILNTPDGILLDSKIVIIPIE